MKIWQFYQKKKAGSTRKGPGRKHPTDLMLVVPRKKHSLPPRPTDPLLAFQAISRAQTQHEQIRLAENLCSEWARYDISLLWNAISRSSLHPELKQHMFNMLWS